MKCEHCNGDFLKEQMLEKNSHFFCCKGCLAVYELVHQNGWEGFYERLGKKSIAPANEKSENTQALQEFIFTNEEGLSEIHLIINEIHCSACVWLNEKALIAKEGVIEANINALTHKAKIVFNPQQITAKELLQTIASIGYSANAYNPFLAEKKAQSTRREFFAKLVVAIACVMNIMWLSVAKYAGFFSGMDTGTKDILNFAEFILATPVLFYTGSSFYKNAYTSLKNKQISMDFLVIFGSSLAYAYSLLAMFSRIGEVYFDSVAMIICFVYIGKYLEVLVKKQASDTMDFLSELLQGEILVFNGKEFVPKAANEVKINDRIKLSAGDKIIIDGVLESGELSLDLSNITGENTPIFSQKDSFLSSGTLVLDGSGIYKATKLYKDSYLAQLIALLENSSTQKPKTQALCDTLSVYFSRTMLFLALVCFCFWFFYQNSGFELALVHSISLLIIACPCALALATPVSNLIALFKALKFKVLFKSAGAIEKLAKCEFGVFDKTGVLTKNALSVTNFHIDKEANLSELCSFLSLSKHPISTSVLHFLKQKFPKIQSDLALQEFSQIRAKGIRASYEGAEFLGGKSEFLKENGVVFDTQFSNTHLLVAKNKKILAFFELESALQNGALELVSFLQKQKIPLLMLTGDNEFAAAKIASKLNIKDFEASCLPERKMQVVKELSQKYKLFMVGDGINDSLALQSANVAISLKQGSDLAKQSADVILLKTDLSLLARTLKLCKKSYKITKQNLLFSLCYNAFCVPLAFLGLINPLFAALSMSASSLIVVLNSLRIKNE